jgi:hypothetical protein
MERLLAMTIKKAKLAAIIKDLKRGLGDVPIMEKYGIRPGEYQEILEILSQNGTLNAEDLACRITQPETPPEDLIEVELEPENEDPRQDRRCYLITHVRVIDAEHRGVQGQLLDLSKFGCQVAGIPCLVGESRELQVEAEVSDGECIRSRFTAECRWEKQEHGSSIAGFEITRISTEDNETLELISQLMAICDSGP